MDSPHPLTTGHIYLAVLFFKARASDMWIAQGLERDISAHGPDLPAAQLAFERTVTGYLKLDAAHGRAPLASLHPAPRPFWDAWERVALKQAASLPSVDPSLPPAYTIAAITTETPALM
jgi:hypothetical protein